MTPSTHQGRRVGWLVPQQSSKFWPGVPSSAPGAEGEILDGHRRVDNIIDEILKIYHEALGNDVTKEDIFHFVYGPLHDPGHRKKRAEDLKKILSYIETSTDRARFDQLVAADRELMALHIGYGNVDRWPLGVHVKASAGPEVRET